jgi:DNA-binding NarL/FixJ family response regulator
VRVFLVDDHELVRKGVADLLAEAGDLTVVGQASSVAQALAEIPDAGADVAVLDIHLPDGNGIELCRELRGLLPDLHCLMLTALDDEQAMLTAILAGASGYAIKDISGSALVTAVRTVGAGGTLADNRTVEALIGRLRADAEPAGRLAALTPRERSVLELLSEGLTNREIGARMSLSENTVKNHVSHVLDKLGVSRRRQAAQLLHRHGDTGRFGSHP